MENKLKKHFKEIAHIINDYAKSKDLKYLTEIENRLKKIFSAQYINFWKYDRYNEQLKLMDASEEKVISLDTSLTQQVIAQKFISVINHCTSEKYYMPKIDNALDLKVRSLIIIPIYRGTECYGVLKIWRGIKERKVFTKQDEAILETLSVLFLRLILSESISKDELMHFTGEVKENTSKRPEIKVQTKTSTVSPSERPNKNKVKENIELQKHKETVLSLDAEITQYKSDLKTLKKKYEVLESSSEAFNNTVKKSQKVIEGLEAERKALMKENSVLQEEIKNESSSEALHNTIQKSQEVIEGLETERKALMKENSVLREENKNMNRIERLKTEKSLKSNSVDIDHNIECLLPHIDTMFSDNEYSYTLFEVILYALYSKKGLTEIEEMVKKSKVLSQIIEGYNFTSNVQVNSEKHILAKLLDNIKSYEKHMFLGEPKINLSVDKSVPVSLVFDKPKVQSIIFHLLIDLYQFINSSKGITINFKLDNKLFIIELGGYIHTDNSLFKSMFKKITLRDDDKDRLGLQMSRKLIKSLKGNIEIIYKDEYYKFIVAFPVQLIKM
ncbi:MAG: hypothetical protein U9O64_09430 [Campylobacterota bacterium]|nr:hypothetical protein [Campylobacterota bacterium]